MCRVPALLQRDQDGDDLVRVAIADMALVAKCPGNGDSMRLRVIDGAFLLGPSLLLGVNGS